MNNPSKISILAGLALAFLICTQSCTKSPVTPVIKPGGGDTTVIPVKTGKSVYVLGGELNTVTNSLNETNYIVEYWKDGKKVIIDSTATDVSKEISNTNMTVINGDVYISGGESINNTSGKPAVFKNGIRTYLPARTTNFAGVYGSCAIGNDLYVLGEDIGNGNFLQTFYWKNGVRSPFFNSIDSTQINFGYCIASNGTDLYIGGKEQADTVYACYWKNGIEIRLPASSTDAASVYAIAFGGSDVYMLGNDGSKYVYWKNGVEMDAPSGFEPGSIAISGSDMYFGGSGGIPTSGITLGEFVKNGASVALPDCGSVSSIFIDGSDVYVSGSTFNFPGKAAYWKNGTEVILSNSIQSASASKIIVQ